MYSPNIEYWTFEVEKYGLVFCLWLDTNTFLFMKFCLCYFMRLNIRYIEEKVNRCKKIVKKTSTQKKIWTFKCHKMNLIFKSPYHVHLLMDFIFFPL